MASLYWLMSVEMVYISILQYWNPKGRFSFKLGNCDILIMGYVRILGPNYDTTADTIIAPMSWFKVFEPHGLRLLSQAMTLLGPWVFHWFYLVIYSFPFKCIWDESFGCVEAYIFPLLIVYQCLSIIHNINCWIAS